VGTLSKPYKTINIGIIKTKMSLKNVTTRKYYLSWSKQEIPQLIVLFVYQNTACIQEFVRAERAFTKRDNIILREERWQLVVGDKN
jgi:hypothetical protein